MDAEARACEIERLMEMTGEQLNAEGLFTFSDLHKRLEELMQRPVWTHELARPQWLADEIRSGKQANMDEIIGKVQQINPNCETIVLVASAPEEAE